MEEKIVALEVTMNMQCKTKNKKNTYKCKYIEVKKENVEEDGEGKRNTSKYLMKKERERARKE